MRFTRGTYCTLKESTIMCVGCRLSTVILTLYKDVPWKGCVEYGYVFLKAKVGGRKVRMQFSLNKGLHLLPHGVYGFPWQSLTREGGSFDRPLSSETVPLYKDVATQIGDFHFVADVISRCFRRQILRVELPQKGNRNFGIGAIAD